MKTEAELQTVLQALSNWLESSPVVAKLKALCLLTCNRLHPAVTSSTWGSPPSDLPSTHNLKYLLLPCKIQHAHTNVHISLPRPVGIELLHLVFTADMQELATSSIARARTIIRLCKQHCTRLCNGKAATTDGI